MISPVQFMVFGFAAGVLWGTQHWVSKRAKDRARAEGREPEEHWNTFLPHAKELTKFERLVAILSYPIAFALLILAVNIG